MFFKMFYRFSTIPRRWGQSERVLAISFIPETPLLSSCLLLSPSSLAQLPTFESRLYFSGFTHPQDCRAAPAFFCWKTMPSHWLDFRVCPSTIIEPFTFGLFWCSDPAQQQAFVTLIMEGKQIVKSMTDLSIWCSILLTSETSLEGSETPCALWDRNKISRDL